MEDLNKSKRQLIEELEKLRSSHRYLLDSVSDAIVITDLDFVVRDWNRAAEQLYGWSATEAVGQRMGRLVPTVTLSDDIDKSKAALKSNGTWTGESVQTARTGKKILVQASVSLIKDDTNRPISAVAINRNIEDRKRAEQALAESQRNLAMAQEITHIGSWHLDLATKQLQWSDELYRIHGLDKDNDTINSDTGLSFIHPDDRQRAETTFKQSIRQGVPYEIEYKIVTAQGEERTIQGIGRFEKDSSGRIVDAYGTCHDITQKKISDYALLRQQNAITLSDSIAGALMSSTGNQMYCEVLAAILSALDSSYGYFGYIDQNGDLVCPSYTFAAQTNDQSTMSNAVIPKTDWSGAWGQSLRERRTLIGNEGFPTPDKEGTIDCAMSVPLIHQGELIGQFCVANRPGGYGPLEQDLLESAAAQTAPILSNLLLEAKQKQERAQLEQQYQHSQKMEAVGRLAGGVAHDFNNLLTIINGYAEIVEAALKQGDPLLAKVHQILKAGDRANSLTRQLLAFSRKQVMEPRVIDLNDVIYELEKMLRRLIGEDIELCTNLTDDLFRIHADPGQIEQVLMNLVVNARDAMPNGGRLTIETTNQELVDGTANALRDLSAGTYVMLAVSDTGEGMSNEVKERIFEPFFTTKKLGHGTGLGLATTYGVVKQSKGGIWVYSEPGQGTCFKLYFPKIEAEKSILSALPQTTNLTGTESVLIVEDEKGVLELAKHILEAAGYRVITALNGGEALLACERSDRQIDLLITDVVMPLMSGKELTDRLASIRPTLKTLYMSGYTDEAIVRHGVLEPGTHFIAKPFSPQNLLKKVRNALGSS